MKVDEFVSLMNKVSRFKFRLQQEGITGEQQQIILKVYIQEFIPKINISLLEVI